MDVQIRFLCELLFDFFSRTISSSVTNIKISHQVEIEWHPKFKPSKQKYSIIIEKSGFKENTIYPKDQ